MPDTDRPVAPDRTFTAARRAQGFRSAAHLAAFFAHFDHVRSCPDCGAPGPAMVLDDGVQPTVAECPEGVRLYLASLSDRFASDTGAEHGPALPTASQLADHPGIGFGAYVGPWITRSGNRVSGTPGARYVIPNPADLRRAGRA